MASTGDKFVRRGKRKPGYYKKEEYKFTQKARCAVFVVGGNRSKDTVGKIEESHPNAAAEDHAERQWIRKHLSALKSELSRAFAELKKADSEAEALGQLRIEMDLAPEPCATCLKEVFPPLRAAVDQALQGKGKQVTILVYMARKGFKRYYEVLAGGRLTEVKNCLAR